LEGRAAGGAGSAHFLLPVSAMLSACGGARIIFAEETPGAARMQS